MFKLLKKRIYTYTVGYKDYREEVEKFSIELQTKYSISHFWLFFVYTILLLSYDFYVWGEFYPKILYGFLLAAVNLVNWIIFRAEIPQKRNMVMKASNAFLFLFLQFLEITYNMSNGYLSQIILLCIILSTAIIGMNPLHYFWIVLLALVTDFSLKVFYLGIHISEMGYLFMENLAIMIIALEINFLLSGMRYRQFMEKVALEKENSIDSLTGLYNRKYFEWFFSRFYLNDKMCAMIHLDLDNFKLCNDSFGHQAGDEVLCGAAAILKKNFRETDCVSRVGGDEFMIFMNGLKGPLEVMEKVEVILNQFPILYGEGEKRVAVNLSIGLAMSHPGDNLSYEEMYLNADAAMYRAKRAGKGRAVVFGKEKGQETVLMSQTSEDL